jgi:tRNA(Ile)-lysidine synthase
MKHVLAISGGVDSVVLLDIVAKGLSPEVASDDCVVAHFDHGTRAESGVDAELVKKLAAKYQMKFVLGQGKLGKNVSEQSARQARYNFLRKVALSLRQTAVSLRAKRSNPEELQNKTGLLRLKPRNGPNGKIVTAHHQDDLIETILMNLIRGTGWRGLAPMWSSDITRPLLKYSKAELVAYAIKNKLEWAEDETNYSPKYFRNRLRDLVVRLSPKQRQELLKLNQKQTKLRAEIESVLDSLPPQNDSADLLSLPENVSLEVLRKATWQKLTTPQLKRLWEKLKTAKSGDLLEPGGGLRIGIYQGQITVSRLG